MPSATSSPAMLSPKAGQLPDTPQTNMNHPRLTTLLTLAFGLLLQLSPLSAAEPDTHGYPEKLVLLTQGPGPREERLRVPIAVYEDADGRRVDLIGAIHLADGAYYRRLNLRFRNYDKLLYEMVNGETLSEMLWLRKQAKRGKATEEQKARLQELEETMAAEREDSLLSSLLNYYYNAMASRVGCTLQIDGIDYGQPNFVYADMSQEEFSAAMQERGESWLSYFAESFAESFKNGSLMQGVALNNASPVELRRSVMHLLVQSMEASTMGDKAIIVARNERCMDVLDRELGNPEVRRVGIFYGAAHLRDMDERLRARGFSLRSVEWMTAWKAGSKLK